MPTLLYYSRLPSLCQLYSVWKVLRNFASANTIYFILLVNTSDSEDLSGGESLAKVQYSKAFPDVASRKTSSGMSPSGKYVQNKETCQKEYSDHLSKVYKWSFQLCEYFSFIFCLLLFGLCQVIWNVLNYWLSIVAFSVFTGRQPKLIWKCTV